MNNTATTLYILLVLMNKNMRYVIHYKVDKNSSNSSYQGKMNLNLFLLTPIKPFHSVPK